VTDAELIAAANHGDAAAFEALYRRHRDWVVNLALRFTGDRDLALDVMQDTFLYLLGKFPGFELTCRLKTFLYPVVRHNALAARRKSRREAGAQASDVLPFVESKSGGAAGSLGGPDLAELHRAVESLEPGHREVLILRFADDLSFQEIAQAMELPLGTVKSRLHHALERLRQDPHLKDFFEKR
jgi:RNA polymerase sigma-70 factor (ECF subfamily)